MNMHNFYCLCVTHVEHYYDVIHPRIKRNNRTIRANVVQSLHMMKERHKASTNSVILLLHFIQIPAC